ncbi:MAG: GTPase SAR1 family protein [Candidatus Kentron sp. G]|nr:MAG: GTPase SAR1 family protein [Candidatus Kentron sp. G]VFN01770.1 MAG: GTPase SAR1 family protein [Candidatus Kentron sp. G]VFN03546.1 MAG: GTPase SAR1 family protein [Candidatus Kentron sp. G]
MKCQQSLVDWIRHELERLAQAPDARDYLITPFPAFLSPGNFLARLQQLPSFEYWADWLQGRYLGRPLDPDVLEKSVNLPEEIKKQSPQAINRYLAELAGGGKQEKIKRVRAIFIGNGEAGKTSLIAALNGREVRPESEEMTRGIAISEWKVPGTNLTTHFWDFGGQVIAHATHQFFLRERCVYVLVLNARGTDSNPNQQAQYWLEFVRAFGNDAPVLLVGNKCDLTPAQVDLNRLRESYPNIRGFHGLAATEYDGKFAREFGIFKDAFTAELAKAGEAARLYFSREEFGLIENLRAQSRQAAFLEKTAFEAACESHGITDREKRQDLLGLLDQLGEVIHFPELYRVHGFRELLLNPRWLTHGVYRLLYSELLKDQHGVLRRTDVVELLKGRSVEDEHGNRLDYPEERLDFLIRAMAEFKLCYPAPDAPHDKWIVPDLLPSDQPEGLGFDQSGGLRFDFRFERFLPRHVLSMFIVEHYRDITNNLAWQHGVCLESRRWNNTRALVRADYQSRVLKLAVTGGHADAYFSKLYDSILTILERMPRLKHTQRLHLDEAARIGGEGAFPGEEATADFEDLLAAKAMGATEFLCKFGRYDLQRLLQPMPKGMERAGVDRIAAEEITGPSPTPAPQPTPEPQATPAPERQPAASSRWEKAMFALAGLGGLAALIGGGGLIGWFGKLYQWLDKVFPSDIIDSPEMALAVVGVVIFAGALIGRWWRRRKGSGNP